MATDKCLMFLEAHNKVRTQPKTILPVLKKRLKLFIDKTNPNICYIRKGYKIMTHEGRDAV